MTTSHQHPFGSAAYWKKRAHTKQENIDRQRAKITRLERLLNASGNYDTDEVPTMIPDDSELEHTREARRTGRSTTQ